MEGICAILRNLVIRKRQGLKSGQKKGVIIGGAGDVGSGFWLLLRELAERYEKYNIEIWGVSDMYAAMYDSSGLDWERLMNFRRAQEKAENRDAVRLMNFFELEKLEKIWLDPD